jgi:VanZ family protein
MRPLRYSALWLAGGMLLVLGVLVGSLGPGVRILMHSDKVVHLSSYLLLALWFGGVYRPSRYPFVIAGLLALGGGIELIQGMLPYRTMDIFDMLANTIGVCTGMLLSWALLGRWCQWIEARLPGAP